jgi:beta-mannosidase
MVQSLDGKWSLSFGPQLGEADVAEAPGGFCTIAARVPGNVEIDLQAAGVIEEPSIGENIYALREYEAFQWWYRRSFKAPAVGPGHRLRLVFEGIDTIATVFVNGRRVGTADNMFLAHAFDVTDAVRAGENELVVRIDSAVLAGRKYQPEPITYAWEYNWEALPVRKAAHMYGWDILPRLVSAGLWRSVRLEVQAPTRLGEVWWSTRSVDAEQRTAAVFMDWHVISERASVEGMSVRVTLSREGKDLHRAEYRVASTHGRQLLQLKGVDLWWPRGFGRADLYEATVTLVDRDGTVLDEHRCRVGIRRIELRRTDTTSVESQGEFVFVVNGHKVFIKGTNHVPLDALHSRDGQHIDALFAMAAELNCNMLRCWGGNVYEDHAFFDRADELGIMIWQDFAFACLIYPQTEDFLSQARREAESVVRKLRNHPSLALWAGNNEIDTSYRLSGIGRDPNEDALSRVVLADVVRRLDPLRPYLPSSPYCSPDAMRAPDPRAAMPEDHLWGPRDDYKGKFYTTSPAHFVSEIGYHGCNNRASLEQMFNEQHLWPWQDNPQWLAKAARPSPDVHIYDYRIPLMARQAGFLFGEIPDDLDDFILASQASQAEALKFFIERMRLGKWRRTGILWWNLRDGWPVISDALVDYYNRRKLAYEYIKRVQADVCPMLAEAVDGEHRAAVVNDTLMPVRGRLMIRGADGERELLQCDVDCPANDIVHLDTIPAAGKPSLYLLDCTLDDGRRFLNHYLAGPRPLPLADFKRFLAAIKPSR